MFLWVTITVGDAINFSEEETESFQNGRCQDKLMQVWNTEVNEKLQKPFYIWVKYLLATVYR